MQQVQMHIEIIPRIISVQSAPHANGKCRQSVVVPVFFCILCCLFVGRRASSPGVCAKYLRQSRW